MKKITLPINLSQEEIKQFCQRHSIQKLSLFGSVLRDDFTTESDVDILVEFNKPIGAEFIDLADELEKILALKVDLVSKRGLKERHLKAIEKELLYV